MSQPVGQPHPVPCDVCGRRLRRLYARVVNGRAVLECKACKPATKRGAL